MKKQYLLIPFILLNSFSFIYGQNLPPVVSIQQVQVDETTQTVTVSYDLEDPENDPCQVLFQLSLDGGETFTATNGLITGDLGNDVLSGTNKSVTWVYQGLPNIYSSIVRIVAEDGNSPDIQAMVDQVDSVALWARLQNVAIPRHHSANVNGLVAIRDTLFQQFSQSGFQTSLHPVFYQGFTFPNVLGRQPGLLDETTTYIVDGHYDGVPNIQGADDNGTAVAATLEIARILSAYTFRKSIRYIGFAFEESGLIGSTAYVLNGIKPYEEIEGVLNIEMIGYYSEEPNSQIIPAGFSLLFPDAVLAIQADQNRGNFLTIVGNTPSLSLNEDFQTACDTWVPDLKYISLSVPGNGSIAPDLRRSDHAPFWEANYKALMLTDGANFRNPHYHQATDTPSTLHPWFFTQSTKAVLATVAMLAEPINAGSDDYALSELVHIHHHHAFPCDIQLYPNPARDLLTIHLGQCAGERLSARLYSMDGKELLSAVLAPLNVEETFSMALPDVLPGVYLLVLDDGHHSRSLPVHIE